MILSKNSYHLLLAGNLWLCIFSSEIKVEPHLSWGGRRGIFWLKPFWKKAGKGESEYNAQKQFVHKNDKDGHQSVKIKAVIQKAIYEENSSTLENYHNYNCA